MVREDKIGHIKDAIGRYDHYYDSINGKGGTYLALNTFILGGLITGYYTIRDTRYYSQGYLVLTVVTICFCILSIGATLWAIMPYFGKSRSPKSILYFKDVASLKIENLRDKINGLSEATLLEDLCCQMLALAKGLNKKFYLLWYATIFIALEIAGLIALGLNIINN